MCKIGVLLVFYCVLVSTSSLKILGLFPHAGKSHFDVFEPLLKALAEKGHELTVVSHFPQKKPLLNYKDISLRKEEVYLDFIDVYSIPDSRIKYYESLDLVSRMAEESCALLETKVMKDLANTKEKFDLTLIEMFNSDCFLGFAHKFQTPFIGLSSCIVLPWTNFRFANPVHPGYVPQFFSPFSDNMNFLERVENLIMLIFNNVVYKFAMEDMSDRTARKFFGEDMPHVRDIAKNASLLLVNTHFSLHGARPAVPSIIDVGGMFLNKKNHIPKHIEKWINESAHGVIYFSMGSMIKGHSFPPETRKAFLKAFSKLPQRVLWKWENESIPDQPSNVMIQKWMPQYDILCHPNVKAYISHGGLLGTTEAVWCGVPMVVMPQYGDQFANAAALQASGGGIILNFNEVTEETVTNTLRTILAPSFNKQAQKLSAAFKDRPMPPLETAIYWVEYVARHGGAHFMRTKAVGMPWYQYLLLDVIAFLLAVFLVIMAVLYYSLKMFFRLFATKGEKIKTN